MDIKEKTNSNNLISIRSVCSRYINNMSSNLDEKNLEWSIAWARGSYHNLLWQQVHYFTIKESFFHKKTNHSDTIYHFIRELVNNGEFILQHCRSKEQLANIFTKALAQEQFEYLRKMLGIVNIDGVLELFSNFYYFRPLQPSALNSSTSPMSLINSPSINTIVNVHILL